MSCLICWPTYYCSEHGVKDPCSRHLTLIADSLFSNTTDGIKYDPILKLGPKILSVPVRVFGSSHNVIHVDSFGLGFVGNTIIGQSAMLLAANTFHNFYCIGPRVFQQPYLNTFAECVGEIATELFASYLKNQKEVQFVLIGNCPKEKKQTACVVTVSHKKYKSTPYFLENEDDFLVLGNDSEKIRDEIVAMRIKAKDDFEKVWMPKTVLLKYAEKQHRNCIGGTIHGGMVEADLGFVLGALYVPIPRKKAMEATSLPPTRITHLGSFAHALQPMEFEWAPVFNKEK